MDWDDLSVWLFEGCIWYGMVCMVCMVVEWIGIETHSLVNKTATKYAGGRVTAM